MQRTSLWKIITATCATLSVCVLTLLPQSKAIADDASVAVLSRIEAYTQLTYQYLYSIDKSVNLILTFLNEWLITPSASDTNDKTGQLQSDFSTYTNTILTTTSINNDLQQNLTSDFLGSEVTPTSAPYTNDLTYQTLLGIPYFSPDPRIKDLIANQNYAEAAGLDPARNYIKNTAGLNIKHILPRDDWQGSDADKQRYKDFYNTVSSIQTFNIHVLGEIYADYKNGGAASAQQANLIQQASNSGWFSVVASEHIGLVLRQILMYNSQLLVVTSQLLQTQKEVLAAQAMTNSLLVLGNQFNENMLLNRATGQSSS